MGNWLGGMTCYYLGRLGKIEWIEADKVKLKKTTKKEDSGDSKSKPKKEKKK